MLARNWKVRPGIGSFSFSKLQGELHVYHMNSGLTKTYATGHLLVLLILELLLLGILLCLLFLWSFFTYHKHLQTLEVSCIKDLLFILCINMLRGWDIWSVICLPTFSLLKPLDITISVMLSSGTSDVYIDKREQTRPAACCWCHSPALICVQTGWMTGNLHLRLWWFFLLACHIVSYKCELRNCLYVFFKSALTTCIHQTETRISLLLIRVKVT